MIKNMIRMADKHIIFLFISALTIMFVFDMTPKQRSRFFIEDVPNTVFLLIKMVMTIAKEVTKEVIILFMKVFIIIVNEMTVLFTALLFG